MLAKATLPKFDASEVESARAFGTYINVSDHRCSCYTNAEGPPQYEKGDKYFCFAKFQHVTFIKGWIGRYAAMSTLYPALDALHETERRIGRPLGAPEWPMIEGILLSGTKPPRTTAKGLQALYQKVELWLKRNMVDEIDHRLVNNVMLGNTWKERNAALCRMYGVHAWARQGTDGQDWMKLHYTTNTLEMLRQTDLRYVMMPVGYEDAADETPESAEKAKASKAAAAALAALQSIETTAEVAQQELIEREEHRYGD